MEPKNAPYLTPPPQPDPEGGEDETPKEPVKLVGTSKKIIQPISSNFQASLPEAPAVPPQPATPNISNIYPTAGAAPGQQYATAPSAEPTATPTVSVPTFLTGSQMQEEKIKTPLGIYIIAGLQLVGVVMSFFGGAQGSLLYTTIMFLDLLLAIGLLARIEAVRITTVVLAGITVCLGLASIILLVGLQQKFNSSRAQYDAAVESIDSSKITAAQQQQLDTLNAQMDAAQKQVGKAITYSYIKLGVTAAEQVAIIVYLTRPRVRAVFHPLKTSAQA